MELERKHRRIPTVDLPVNLKTFSHTLFTTFFLWTSLQLILIVRPWVSDDGKEGFRRETVRKRRLRWKDLGEEWSRRVEASWIRARLNWKRGLRVWCIEVWWESGGWIKGDRRKNVKGECKLAMRVLDKGE